MIVPLFVVWSFQPHPPHEEVNSPAGFGRSPRVINDFINLVTLTVKYGNPFTSVGVSSVSPLCLTALWQNGSEAEFN